MSVSRAGRRVLVTGAAGFVGRYALAAIAAASGPDDLVLGVGRGTHPQPPAGTRFAALDLDDLPAVQMCLGEFRPTHILHLAAMASVGQAATAAGETWRANVASLLNLAETVTAHAPEAAFLFASSGEVYGRAFLSGEPLDETAEPQPAGSYARTKWVGEMLLRDVLGRTGVRLVILRPFNHTGPGQDERFVVPSFAGQIARIEAGLGPARIEVGNLSAEREFLDVRDVARAYAMVIDRAGDLEPGTVLNVASGAPRTIASVLDDLLAHARVPCEVVVAQDRLRPSEIPVALGEAGRLRAATGWEPVIPWSETLADVLAEARRRAPIDARERAAAR